MSKYIPGNQKHLTLEGRKYIEKSLNAGLTFRYIARYLCKDPHNDLKRNSSAQTQRLVSQGQL